MAALTRSGTMTLQQLVDAVGPALNNTQSLGSLLGLQSTWVAQMILGMDPKALEKTNIWTIAPTPASEFCLPAPHAHFNKPYFDLL
ncbi:unnamed protein product [Pleuronectes platessa]|uniref:Uncharacterized protein n=1 Tax=Pleuronectes platessa TaxID=8262 RepID=A0A9N7YJ26_PLEPL|nr:unnamed protein product [Pleuronectes platessa]